MKAQRLLISLVFNDAILPVIDCPDGHQRVPLKPICDQIGLLWKGQKRKLLNDEYLVERFGLVQGVAGYPHMAALGFKNDQYFIRLDRVVAFLNTLNPRNIAARGNEEAAAWLKAKHQEWDDALHAYETIGVAAKPREQQGCLNALYKLDRMQNQGLKQIAAAQINHDYGLDIPLGHQGAMDL